MNYPKVLSEDDTLDLAIAGRSLARYGDGELKVILGANCISQIYDQKLATEMANILKKSEALACIPNSMAQGTKPAWLGYTRPEYARLYTNKVYGSSFVSRPDSAPWIDRTEYWEKVNSIWKGKDVTLVIGTERSLHKGSLPGAASIREVWGPRRDAYAEIDRIEAEIGEPSGPVLLCLGCTATVLAERLAKKGVWAIDLGHIGMFQRHAGSYRYQLNELISPKYQEQNKILHANPKGFGGDGYKHAEIVWDFIQQVNPETILDYGCGEGTIKPALVKLGCKPRVFEYDPGMPGKEGMPKPCDFIICTDVLEHIEPDKLDAVLNHIYSLATKAVYFVIATRPANKILPDGRNAHLIVEPAEWWTSKLSSKGFKLLKQDGKVGFDLKLWCLK